MADDCEGVGEASRHLNASMPLDTATDHGRVGGPGPQLVLCESYSQFVILRILDFAGHFLKCPLPNIEHEMINVAFVALLDHAPLPKRRAPKNDADWCNRFVQNSHREPIGDKTDSCQICNLARWEVSEMPPAKYSKYNDDCTKNKAHEQHMLFDIILDYKFYFGSPGTYPSPKTPLHVGRFCSWFVLFCVSLL